MAGRYRHAPWGDRLLPRGNLGRYPAAAMLERFRQFWTKVWAPLGNLLLRMGVSPNAVTLVGTLGVCAGALIFFPQAGCSPGSWSSLPSCSAT